MSASASPPSSRRSPPSSSIVFPSPSPPTPLSSASPPASAELRFTHGGGSASHSQHPSSIPAHLLRSATNQSPTAFRSASNTPKQNATPREMGLMHGHQQQQQQMQDRDPESPSKGHKQANWKQYSQWRPRSAQRKDGRE